jgi:nickel/cobalt exporter
MSLAAALVLGLALGLRHAADPDHLVVLATLVERERTFARAVRPALLWGLGHTTTFLLVGVGVVVLGVKLPPSFDRGTELAVAAMLVAVGVLHLARRGAQERLCPGAERSAQARAGGAPGWSGALRPLGVGLVHGLAGSASIALIGLSTIRSRAGAVLYLILFCAGTAAGMAMITAALYLPMSRIVARDRVRRVLALSAAVASVVFGLALGAGALLAARG